VLIMRTRPPRIDAAFLTHTGPRATSIGPAWPSRVAGWLARRTSVWTFPCCAALPSARMPAPVPQRTPWMLVSCA